MTTPPRARDPRRRARPSAGRGFTLVELLAVVAMIGLIAGVSVASLTSAPSTRRRAAAHSLARDLAFARDRATATGAASWVVFTVASSRYALLAENPLTPGRAQAAAVRDPATGRNYERTLNTGEFLGVRITSASLGGGSELGFDWRGRPLGTGGSPLTTAATITLTGPVSVTVEPGTGLIRTP